MEIKKYDSYKDSGVEWIGKYPVDWKLMTVRRVTDIHKQGFYSSDSYKTDGYRLVRITDLDANGNIDISNSPFVHPTDKELEVFDIKKGDILFPRTGSIGLVGVAKEDLKAVFASYLIRFRFLESTYNSYMRYYFVSEVFINGLFSDLHGGVNQNIHAENIKDQYLVLPTLEEQTQIANYLDHKTTQIDDLISKKEQLIELLKEERTAIINQAVTKGLDPNVPMKDSGIEWLGKIPEHWDVKRLKYIVASPLKYGANEPAIDEVPTDSRYIRITDFGKDGKLRKDTFKSLPFEKAENYLLEEGDILFARSGATVGKTFLFTDYEGNACFAGYLIKVTCNSEIMHYKFLYAFTNSSGYDGWKDSISQSATIENIGADKYNQLKLAVPPIDEQVRIVDFIESQENIFENISSKTLKEIELLKEYKTALISEVVTGKVDVRDEVIKTNRDV